jgi:hypothetical protein
VTERKHPYNEEVTRALDRLESEYQRRQLEQQDQRSNRGLGNTVVSNSNGNNFICSKHQLISPKPVLYNTSPLRELDLYIAYGRLSYLDKFTYPSSLTKLTITLGYSYYTHLDLSRILQGCPLLEHFWAEVQGLPILRFAMFSFTSTITTQQRKKQRPFRLQSLVFFNVYFAQDDLESLLYFTPNLKELKLVATAWNDDKKYNWTRLFAYLKENNITLDKAHFSMLGNKMSAEEIELLWNGVCPRSSSERSLWALDVTPQLLQKVFLQQDSLTTLEVLWKSDKQFPSRIDCYETLEKAHRLIHKYLCDCPQLAHLTTLKTVIRLKELDLFGREGYINLGGPHDDIVPDRKYFSTSSPGSSPPPQIWRCRRLRTLHIIVHFPDPFRPVFSRILFGYVARVCPVVEDLRIGIPRLCHFSGVSDRSRGQGAPNLYLRLDGGLCLLGSMQYLQRLRVFQDMGDRFLTCADWDLNWIADSNNGRKSARSRKKRQLEVESWRLWLANEERVEAARCQLQQQQPVEDWISNSGGSSSGSSAKDREVLFQLRNLGLLLDVDEVAKRMDEKETRLLPSLERLSFNHPTLLRPEEELERIFSESYALES